MIAGLNDLHSFVNVALATSAEDDLSTKMISDLRTIGNAVDLLISDFPKSSGCLQLLERCSVLLEIKSFSQLLVKVPLPCMIIINTDFAVCLLFISKTVGRNWVTLRRSEPL